MTPWLDNFEGGVPHADRDRSESVQPLGSAGLSGQGGYSATPCPTKAVLSGVDELRANLTEAYILIGDLSAKLADKDDVLAKVSDLSDRWREFGPKSMGAWGEGYQVAMHTAGNILYRLVSR